MELKKQKKK